MSFSSYFCFDLRSLCEGDTFHGVLVLVREGRLSPVTVFFFALHFPDWRVPATTWRMPATPCRTVLTLRITVEGFTATMALDPFVVPHACRIPFPFSGDVLELTRSSDCTALSDKFSSTYFSFEFAGMCCSAVYVAKGGGLGKGWGGDQWQSDRIMF